MIDWGYAILLATLGGGLIDDTMRTLNPVLKQLAPGVASQQTQEIKSPRGCRIRSCGECFLWRGSNPRK